MTYEAVTSTLLAAALTCLGICAIFALVLFFKKNVDETKIARPFLRIAALAFLLFSINLTIANVQPSTNYAGTVTALECSHHKGVSCYITLTGNQAPPFRLEITGTAGEAYFTTGTHVRATAGRDRYIRSATKDDGTLYTPASPWFLTAFVFLLACILFGLTLLPSARQG